MTNRSRLISIAANTALAITCTIGSLLPPLSLLSLVNAGLAGAGLTMVVTLIIDLRRDRAYDAMSDAFFATSAMNDDLIARLHRRELGLDHDPAPNQSNTSLH